jgi:hypothetical protein
MFELNADLIVKVMSESSSKERESWVRLSLQSLARAYGDDEPEYSRDQIKEANAEYAVSR